MLGAVSTSAEVRTVLEGHQPYSAQTWSRLGELGALSLTIPEAYGGSGMGCLELCLVSMEAGRNLVAAPLLGSVYLAGEALLAAGTKAQKTRWLPQIASGKMIATAALELRSEQVLPDETPRIVNGRLVGAVHAVPEGMIAELAIVHADGKLIAVILDQPGVSRMPADSIDPTRPLATLRFHEAEYEELGEVGNTSAVARRVMEGAAIFTAFEQLGGALQALEVARLYSLERQAFGRPIGGFQALKHKMADIYVAAELARVHAYYGAWALSTNAPELSRAAAAARVAATVAYNLAAAESLHVHGGIGFTWEMDCHLHMRRARWLAQILGSEHSWRLRLGRAVIEEALA